MMSSRPGLFVMGAGNSYAMLRCTRLHCSLSIKMIEGYAYMYASGIQTTETLTDPSLFKTLRHLQLARGDATKAVDFV